MSNSKKTVYDSYSDPSTLSKDKSQKYLTKNMQDYKDYINENFKVVVRVRPPLPREITSDKFISTVRKEIIFYIISIKGSSQSRSQASLSLRVFFRPNRIQPFRRIYR